MLSTQLFVLALVLISAPSVSATVAGNKTKVIFLMMENRSFDHLFGFLTKDLSGNEFNRVNSSDLNSKKVFLKRNPAYVLDCDADHSTPATTAKVFGLSNEERFGPGFAGDALMNGFVEWELTKLKNNASVNYCQVMTAYEPDKVPVATFLANEFALFTQYYSSLAGPTWPNRAFALSGTSFGLTETGPWYKEEGRFFPQKLFPELLMERNHSWKGYYKDTPWDLWLGGLAHNLDHLVAWDEFKKDCKEGTLPDWSWIWPRAAWSPGNGTESLGSDDQHPDHDIALGEALLKETYELVRASPDWDKGNVLLLITWDEHGGLWDKAGPPSSPSPDDEPSSPDSDVKFNRLGVRVPLLAISPRIPRGTRVGAPSESQKPFATSQFDHTSMIATTRKLFGIKEPMTRRDAWAATFEDILSLSQPRSDAPMKAPAAPKPTQFDEHLRPVNELQMHMSSVHRNFGTHPLRRGSTQGTVKLSDSFKRMKSHFNSLDYRVYFAAGYDNNPPSNQKEAHWEIGAGMVKSKSFSVDHGAHICLDNGVGPHGTVGASRCSGAQSQRMDLLPDSRIQNAAKQCLTILDALDASNPHTDPTMGLRPLKFLPCIDGDATQHFAWAQGAPGNSPELLVIWGASYMAAYKV